MAFPGIARSPWRLLGAGGMQLCEDLLRPGRRVRDSRHVVRDVVCTCRVAESPLRREQLERDGKGGGKGAGRPGKPELRLGQGCQWGVQQALTPVFK